MSLQILFAEHCPISKISSEENELGESIKKLVSLEQEKLITLEGHPKDYETVPKYLGIESTENEYVAGYYIGATWLQEKYLSAVVLPKMPDIDFLEMFSEALEVNSEKESSYFSNYYGFEFSQPEIEVEASFNILTPLILLHYISVLKNLTKQGLKKGYVYREKNLQSKIKGHLLIQSHFRKNVINHREDRNYCGFQEYTEDIPENRLLKKALVFTNLAIKNYASLTKQSIYEAITLSINKLLSVFVNVSDEIEIFEVKTMKNNKLFATYKEAIQLAKTILRKFDYSLQNTETEEKKTVPFWIDMPRLYELYVYSKLKKCYGDNVEFQVKGHYGTSADYILKGQNIILDAKYKPQYENSNSGILDDIREMSGYARDTLILSHFINPALEVPCVIIYPEKIDDETDSFKESYLTNNMDIVNNATKIKAFRNFYKFKIEVPRLRL